MPLKLTLVTLTKFVPVMVTVEFTAPAAGENEAMVGVPSPVRTTKLALLVAVPLGVVTVTTPEVADAGTVAVICVAETTTYAALIPLKVTPEAVLRLVPVMVTVEPVRP